MNHECTMSCGLLRLFDRFGGEVDTRIPPFHYDRVEEGLSKLRETYGLDGIAGHGNDWSRTVRLLGWLCENVHHDGNSALSVEPNALAVLASSFGKGKGFGVNCRMLATALAEACLSIGLVARIASLHPINPYDFDNHVVTLVWNRPLSRWTMVDPAFHAYLTDAEGVVINPWEARDLLCRHREVKCNAEISHNGEPYAADDYLAYMAKNLFYMHSPLWNGFGSEMLPDRKLVWLVPEGFDAAKRETCNWQWRQSGGEGPCEDEDAEQAWRERMDGRPGHIYTTSIATYAQAPVDWK